MLKFMSKRLSIWWKFKQLDRTYQPLLDKALTFENREALLKLEEQYWYQTACLLEERRELRKAQTMGSTQFPAHHQYTGNGNQNFSSQKPLGQFGSERDITYQHQNAAWKLVGFIVGGLITGGVAFWLVAVNTSTKLISIPGIPY
jgi:predicted RNA binding protein with dsRBD fold (UPF0201 family)